MTVWILVWDIRIWELFCSDVKYLQTFCVWDDTGWVQAEILFMCACQCKSKKLPAFCEHRLSVNLIEFWELCPVIYAKCYLSMSGWLAPFSILLDTLAFRLVYPCQYFSSFSSHRLNVPGCIVSGYHCMRLRRLGCSVVASTLCFWINSGFNRITLFRYICLMS